MAYEKHTETEGEAAVDLPRLVRPAEAIKLPISPGSRGDKLAVAITSLLIRMGEGDEMSAPHLAIGAVAAIAKRQAAWPNT
jgi:hypothetical protein